MCGRLYRIYVIVMIYYRRRSQNLRIVCHNHPINSKLSTADIRFMVHKRGRKVLSGPHCLFYYVTALGNATITFIQFITMCAYVCVCVCLYVIENWWEQYRTGMSYWKMTANVCPLKLVTLTAKWKLRIK